MKNKTNSLFLNSLIFFISINLFFTTQNNSTLEQDNFEQSFFQQMDQEQVNINPEPIYIEENNQTPIKINCKTSWFSLSQFNINAKLKSCTLPGMIGCFPKTIDLIIKKLKIPPISNSEKVQQNLLHNSKTNTQDHKKNTNLNRLILHGPPGNGKSTIARKIALAGNCRFKEVVASDFMNKYVGMSTQNINNIFTQIEQMYDDYKEKIVLFIDEIDSLEANFESEIHTEHIAAAQKLWTMLDLYKEKDYFFLIVATNNLHKINKTFLDRFGANIIEIKNPDADTRKEFLEHYLNKTNIQYDKNVINKLIKKTDGLSIRAIEDCFITIKDYIDTQKNEIHIDTIFDIIQTSKKQKSIKDILATINLDILKKVTTISYDVIMISVAIYNILQFSGKN